MKPNFDCTLYLVTDRNLMTAKTIEDSVQQALIGGCTLVQLREKNCSSLEFYQLALRVKAITDAYSVPLLINDRLDIALAVDASGVHLGQSDLPAAIARRLLGNDKILGVSASNRTLAIKAQSDGADYVGVGAMFATTTKTNTTPVSMDELRAIRQALTIPIVVIGGINQHTIQQFAGTGIDGAAVVSAIVGQADIAQAAREMKRLAARLAQ